MDMVVELMRDFKIKCQGREPQRIIFYRDGVSEGQYQQVKEVVPGVRGKLFAPLNSRDEVFQVMIDELRAIQAACTKLCPNGDYKPPIT